MLLEWQMILSVACDSITISQNGFDFDLEYPLIYELHLFPSCSGLGEFKVCGGFIRVTSGHNCPKILNQSNYIQRGSHQTETGRKTMKSQRGRKHIDWGSWGTGRGTEWVIWRGNDSEEEKRIGRMMRWNTEKWILWAGGLKTIERRGCKRKRNRSVRRTSMISEKQNDPSL